MKKILLVMLVALGLVFVGYGFAQQKDASPNLTRPERKAAPDHILVKFKDNVGQEKKVELLLKHGLKEKSEIKQIGVKLPRTAIEQAMIGTKIQLKKIKKGDIIFLKSEIGRYNKYFPDGIGHAGLYIGEGKVIHADRKRIMDCIRQIYIHQIGRHGKFPYPVGDFQGDFTTAVFQDRQVRQ